MTQDPQITVVIAVHSALRPIARAVESCLSSSKPGLVRVVIVCHNIAVEKIKAQLPDTPPEALRFLTLMDGTRSPAGPKNLGLRECTTPYVMVLDSDDYLEPGALDHWYGRMLRWGARGVIAPLKLQRGTIVRTPRARVGRRRALDAVKDQLAYATAPRGLWSTELLRSTGFTYTEGLRTAEDLAPGLKLWFSGARFDYPVGGPSYVLGEDATDRVTSDILPLDEEFQAVFRVGEDWWGTLTPAARQSVAVKLVRIHLLGALGRRGPDWPWNDADRAAVKQFIASVRAMSAKVGQPLSIAERDAIDSLSMDNAGSERYRLAITSYIRAGYWAKLLGPGLLSNVHRQSTFRHQLRLKLYPLFDR